MIFDIISARNTLLVSLIFSSSIAMANDKRYIAAPKGAAVSILSGFSALWQSGETWDSGQPTATGAQVLRQNMAINAALARNRTPEDELKTYLFDRRNQNYSLLAGLGPLEILFINETGATTTINSIPPQAYLSRIDDEGTGLGSTDSGLGKVIELVDVLRGDNASTNPAKEYYSYPRPFRQTLDGESLDWVTMASLVPARSPTPETDGGFPSGHTNAAFLAGLGLAWAIPQQYSALMLQAADLGYSRAVAGMHSPLDVIGGRMHAIFYAIENLMANPELRADALQQAQSFYTTACNGEITYCYSSENAEIAYQQYQADKAEYLAKTTFAFIPSGDTTQAPVVPENAGILIESRYPYLTDAQRREILATTETPSGGPLDNGMGYDRLNLFAAANGYGAFNHDVVVTMDAAQGGLSAADVWLNDITGEGSFNKAGSGQLTLAGRNSWSGGTLVSDGTLIGTNGLAFGSGEIANNALLVIDIINNDELNNALSGEGTFRKQGLATLSYDGDGSRYSGNTEVTKGTLLVNGSLGGTMTVENGAVLGGEGQVGSTVIHSGGTLAPGDALNINGDLHLESDSMLRINANQSSHDSVKIAGKTQLDDGSALTLIPSKNILLNTPYAILQSQGGINGTFSEIHSEYAFLQPTLSYGGNTLNLQLTRNDTPFASLANSPNQAAVARSIESQGPHNPLYDRLLTSVKNDAFTTLDTLSGEGYASLTTSTVSQALMLSDQLIKQSRIAEENTVWLTAWGNRHHSESNHNVASATANTWGLMMGADGKIADELKLGMTAGVGKSSTTIPARRFSAQGDTFHTGLYLDYRYDKFSASAGIIGGWNRLDVERYAHLDDINDKLTSSPNNTVIQLVSELRYTVDATPIAFEPYLGLTNMTVKQEAFTEHGGVTALNGEKQTYQLTFTTIGVRFSHDFSARNIPFAISAGAGWRHSVGDTEPSATLNFAHGQPFAVEGAPVSSNSSKLDAEIIWSLTPTSKVSLGYAGQLSGHTMDNSAMLNFSAQL